MIRQNGVAKSNDYTFLRTPAEVWAAVKAGRLVRLEGNADYMIAGASFPVARREMRVFIERLGAQHRAACGDRLVVTSLTRPKVRQPPNASPLSVHPAGMAVDLRVARDARCRRWLERTLLSMESDGLLDVTREYNPPHYHVALFPEEYMAHVASLVEKSIRAEEDAAALSAVLDALDARAALAAEPQAAPAPAPKPAVGLASLVGPLLLFGIMARRPRAVRRLRAMARARARRAK